MIELEESFMRGRIFVDSCLFLAAYNGKQEKNSELALKLLNYAAKNNKLFVPAPVLAEILSHQNNDSIKEAIKQFQLYGSFTVVSFGNTEAALFSDDSFCSRIVGKSKHFIKYDKMIISCVKTRFNKERGDVFLTLDDAARCFALKNGINAPTLVELTKPQKSLFCEEVKNTQPRQTGRTYRRNKKSPLQRRAFVFLESELVPFWKKLPMCALHQGNTQSFFITSPFKNSTNTTQSSTSS